MKVVIIGGVAGGATAAARIRRLKEDAQITVYERTGYISYANCGLPYYIGDVIGKRENLTLNSPESFKIKHNIDVKVHHEVTKIVPENKKIIVKNLSTGESFEDTYDKLLLSPGAKPLIPDVEGINLDKVFTLRTVEDAIRIKEYITENKPQSAVIAGGGFISVELAENLCNQGVDVTIVQRPTQLMNPFDKEIAAYIHRHMKTKGIKLQLGETVTGFREKEEHVEVTLKDNKSICSQIAIVAIGVVPETTLAKEAGLKLGLKDSIVVNEKMETSIPDIYAVGDAVSIKHKVTGQDTLIALAGPANKQGRIAAENICGGCQTYKGSQGSSVVKIFDITVASTGINETNAKKSGIETDKVILWPKNHAVYYPGSTNMLIKAVFEKNTMKLLGAQIAGVEGVDKRIDVLATAIGAGMKITDLMDLDLAYAPPYSSAKDPVNMIGYMADDIEKGLLKQWFVEDLESLSKVENITFLDVRSKEEYARGHIEGFINIPVETLRQNLNLLDKNKPVYAMCQSGARSYTATRILSENGFEAYNLAGGYSFYQLQIQDRDS